VDRSVGTGTSSCRGSMRRRRYAGPDVEFIVCRRVTQLDEPLVESEQSVCIECREKIWVSKKALSMVIAPTICLECATKAVKEWK